MVDSQGLKGKAAGDFLLSSLEGPAKKEVRFADEAVRESPDAIFELLKKSFGERSTLAQLVSTLFSRKQNERESLRDFSHALLELADRINSVEADALPNRDKLLRDHFIEKLRDRQLRRDLAKCTRDDPSISFREIREEAFLLSPGEEAHVTSRVVECDMNSQLSPLQEVTQLLKGVAQQQQKQQEIMEQQQQQIQLLMNQSTSLQRPVQRTSPGQGPPQQKRKCYGCGSTDHLVRDCPEKRAKQGQSQDDTNRGNSSTSTQSHTTLVKMNECC